MRVLPGTCGMSIDARVTPVRELRTAPLRLEGQKPQRGSLKSLSASPPKESLSIARPVTDVASDGMVVEF